MTKAETDEMGRKKTGRNICCHFKYLANFHTPEGVLILNGRTGICAHCGLCTIFLEGVKGEGLGVEGKFVSFSMISGGYKLSELFLGD